MSMQLRPYQRDMIDRINAQWAAGARNVLAVLPTGAGKTVMFSHMIADHNGPSAVIAHRKELLGQISVALAREGVVHRIVGPSNVRRYIRQLQIEATGRIYYDPQSPVGVAGVDTLIRRPRELAGWLRTITMWVQDEGHHILRDNKWGRAAAMMPNARGLAVTATAYRADGQGLGRHHDGLMDAIVTGPGMRETINAGYLTDYRPFAPSIPGLDLSNVKTSASTGEYNREQLVKTVRDCSHIVGNVVDHYQRIALGKLGITFVTDVNTGTDIVDGYRSAGIPAEIVTHKTADAARSAILRRFRNREILQLVNIDLFGEGFDLPAVEVVSFVRPTQSYGLYVQQFGRALRPLEGKSRAIIIDHVHNILRHGLPDTVRTWSLDRRVRRQSVDTSIVPVRICPECTYVYERIHRICPSCGFYPEPATRSTPQHVDGDLTELDAETLARMRGDVERVNMDPLQYRAQLIGQRCPPVVVNTNVKYHKGRQDVQGDLRLAIAVWGAQRRAEGMPDNESYRVFFHRYGIDVLSAQTLGIKDAKRLLEVINNNGVA